MLSPKESLDGLVFTERPELTQRLLLRLGVEHAPHRIGLEALTRSDLSSLGHDLGLNATERVRLHTLQLTLRSMNCPRGTPLEGTSLAGDLHRALRQDLPPPGFASRVEWIGFFPLYRDRSVGPFCALSSGTERSVHFEPRELFTRLLPLRAEGFYLAHFHPSGDPTPSSEDVRLTTRLKSLARAVGVPLLGHLVVTCCEARWVGLPVRICDRSRTNVHAHTVHHSLTSDPTLSKMRKAH